MAAMFLNHNFSYGLPAVAGNQSAFNTADYHHQPQVAHHHEVKPTMMAPMAPPPSCTFGAHHHQHQLQQQMLAAPSYVGRGGYDHKPILAERFKTKMCKNYIEQGACPYVFRCMFAHGEHELRTKQMNMADGLVTEEAIKAFKRARFEAEKATYFASLSTTVVSGATGRRRNDPYASVTSWHPFATFPSSSVATAVPTTPTSSSCAAASSQFAAPSPARTMTPLPEQIASSDSDCDFASSSLYCC